MTLHEEAGETDFPKKLEILDDEVDVILRKMLDETFVDLAKKPGIDLNGSKGSLYFEYDINCEIKEK